MFFEKLKVVVRAVALVSFGLLPLWRAYHGLDYNAGLVGLGVCLAFALCMILTATAMLEPRRS